MTDRPRVFLDVNIGAEPAGRLTIELFADKTPKTCENFRQLCTGDYKGLSYAKAPFHRVIDQFMIQGGDIVNGDGTGVVSIYGNEFEDENLAWREMSAKGLVCSANRGKDTNGSQFFITLEACPHLNGKHTIFGRLVSGEDTLLKVAKVSVDDNDRPDTAVLVSRCGELERKRKPAAFQSERQQISISGDRGRRPRDSDSVLEMSSAPLSPRSPRRIRRQSDNVIDEGIRGRPRNRSTTRSESQPIVEDSESETQDSPVKMHKRKRSPSPSRVAKPESDSRCESEEQRRRRRSLPNQYKDARDNADGDRYRPSPRRDQYAHSGRRREDAYPDRRENDHFRRHERAGARNDGRLGGGDRYEDQHEAPVRFKGRGIMKYREPDRL